MAARPKVDGQPTPEEARALKGIKHYRDWDSGYSKQQSTRPQTVGYGLTDSPSGQAAWILEKFWAWTDCDGHPENCFTREQMLTNVMLYWATQTSASSARLYWESRHSGSSAPPLPFVHVPTGVARYPKEILRWPRSWVERQYNVVHWAVLARGGHFAAMEQPDLFVEDLRSFVRTVR